MTPIEEQLCELMHEVVPPLGGVSFESVARRVHRRRRAGFAASGFSAAAVIALVTALVLTLVGSSGQDTQRVTTSPAPGVAQTTTFDGGALTITTARPQATPVSQAAAEFELGHSTLAGGGWARQQVELGYVTVKPSAMKAYNSGEAVPAAPNRQLSWVLFYHQGKSGCGTNSGNEPSPNYTVAQPSRKLAMIVDSATGTALSYEGAGSASCTTVLSPRVTKAGGYVSVPWKDSGSNYVVATFPACVQPNGNAGPGETDATGTSFSLLGFRFYEPCHGMPTTVKVPVTFPRPWKHAGVGSVATGTSG
jgi:hypothetical protein